MALDSLPLELICLIASYLPWDQNRLSLLCSNRKLYDKVIYALYKQSPHTATCLFGWLLERGFEQGIQHLISRNNLDLNLAMASRISVNDQPLLVAICWGRPGVVELLLRNGAHVNLGTNIPALELAATLGNYQITKLLLQSGAHVDLMGEKSGSTALAHAVNLGYSFGEETKTQQDPMYRRFKPALYKDPTEYADVIRLLLSHGADPNCRSRLDLSTPLLQIAERPWDSTGNVVGRLLVDYGAELNTQDIYGSTPLHAALRDTAFAGNATVQKEWLRCLLKSGVNVNQKDRYNQPPFGHTFEDQYAIKSVLEQSADSPRHAESAVKIMLNLLGVPLKMQSKNYKTRGNKHHGINMLIEILVDHGAQPERYIDGRSPLDMPAAKFYPVLRDMIRKKRLSSTGSRSQTPEQAVDAHWLRKSTTRTKILRPRQCTQGTGALK